MEELFWYLERLERIGPWIALLVYYFLRLDRQMCRVIELLEDIRRLVIQYGIVDSQE